MFTYNEHPKQNIYI